MACVKACERWLPVLWLTPVKNHSGPQVKVKACTNPRWVAPEVQQSMEMTKKGDVWSFGMVLYEALTWHLPFEGVMDSLQVGVGWGEG
jgi:serine/threonine protein kinase